jgi:hypothetical protein
MEMSCPRRNVVGTKKTAKKECALRDSNPENTKAARKGPETKRMEDRPKLKFSWVTAAKKGVIKQRKASTGATPVK